MDVEQVLVNGIVATLMFSPLSFLAALPFNAGRRLRNREVNVVRASGRFARVCLLSMLGFVGIAGVAVALT